MSTDGGQKNFLFFENISTQKIVDFFYHIWYNIYRSSVKLFQEDNFMKKKLSLLLVAVLLLTCVSCGTQEVVEADLKYYPLPDETYSVSAGTLLYMDHIEIPATYQGKPVVEICKEGFMCVSNLESVSIAQGIETIREYAFSSCENAGRLYTAYIFKNRKGGVFY